MSAEHTIEAEALLLWATCGSVAPSEDAHVRLCDPLYCPRPSVTALG